MIKRPTFVEVGLYPLLLIDLSQNAVFIIICLTRAVANVIIQIGKAVKRHEPINKKTRLAAVFYESYSFDYRKGK